MGVRITQEQFIKNARATHGDFYDYSKSVYTTTHKKVIITCPEHGDFTQTPANHCFGQRCPQCGDKVKSLKKTKTQDEFIMECRVMHGDAYDYSNTKYTGVFNQITVICKVHGEFTQIAHDHQRGRGCNKCGTIKRGQSQMYDTNKFIEMSNKRHDYFYDYSKSVYTGAFNKVEIICPVHGSFLQQASIHYGKMGAGCPMCATGESYKFEDIDTILGRSKREATFDGCKDKKKLRFDRYVKSKNILLEYDGEQHFRINKVWNPDDSFSDLIRRDKIKTEYAINNGYNFIRIKYSEDHVKALESFLTLVLKHQDKQIVQIYGEVQILDKK